MSRISSLPSMGALLWLAVLTSPLLMGASTCNLRGLENMPKASKKRTYAQNAKHFYETAKRELKGGNFSQARKIFRQLKTAYPFSQYATLAEVGIADTFFKAGKYIQAVDLYRLFVKLHPSHKQNPYATYRIALCYYKQRPFEWFLIPPNHEKDSSVTKQAIKAYRVFLQQYPNHKLAKKATKDLRTCVQQLAKHELYVARFYASRGKHQAVVWRMEHLLKNFPLANYNAEARLRMAKAYIKMKDPKKARGVLKVLLKKEPKSKQATEAKKKLVEVESAIALLDKSKKAKDKKKRVLTASATNAKKVAKSSAGLTSPDNKTSALNTSPTKSQTPSM